MLTVNDLMTVDPLTVVPETLLRTVLQLMKAECCRQLPVLDERRRLVGIITDRDVRLALNSPILPDGGQENQILLNTVTVESCMTTDPLTVTPDTPAFRAAEMLSTYKFGALPVVDGEALVGIITVTDFLDEFVQEHKTNVVFQAEPNERPSA